ncbi:DUF1028 domain-containing protein [Planctomicrobium piriforme]|uniref:Uncharacterized conserved protein, Ntn-hydrolase superfamily n=1 Tax=Planctomicrobium piriforme TaxID=1576369 RepID=A0A1I3B543_9PLAN|nr:DUF1028 domain-containing protein [Planctomicrobium piriforme]SFH57393.1 Uncharacterized conserved protein, Ntn-hydrolase superfamily [Planctomicrobium piriforme]
MSRLFSLNTQHSTLNPFALLLLLSATVTAAEPESPPSGPLVNTFSIVACDLENKEWGVAVASKYLAVGSICPWAQGDVGAIATQSYVNPDYGPKGLELLKAGKTAEETVKLLTEADGGREYRQLGIVDSQGNPATYTGSKCMPWCGGKTGKNFACQGNILAGPEVVDAMAEAFEKTTRPLAWKMLAALEAADAKGGDTRGKQSASILVVRRYNPEALYDRVIDYRVDDHAAPIPELARILSLGLPKPGAEPAAGE